MEKEDSGQYDELVTEMLEGILPVTTVPNDAPSTTADTSVEIPMELMASRPHQVPATRRQFDPMPPHILIEATFWPGFSADLTSWRLTIDKDGQLLQNIRISNSENGYARVEHQEQVRMGLEDVDRLLQKAQEIGFVSFLDRYSISVTDMPTYELCVRVGEEEKRVYVYGLGWLVLDGHLEMKGFLELWEMVHAQAPFPPQ